VRRGSQKVEVCSRAELDSAVSDALSAHGDGDTAWLYVDLGIATKVREAEDVVMEAEAVEEEEMAEDS